MLKKKAEQIHASKRFLERGLINFSKRTNELFCRYIRTQNNVKFVERQSNRITLWDITHENKIYRCVYDKQRKQIVTLLWVQEIKPPEPIPIPEKEPRIFKYGVFWNSAKKLQKHETMLREKYEKNYEQWASLNFNSDTGQEMTVIPCEHYNDCALARRIECLWEKCEAYHSISGNKFEEFKVLAQDFLT